MPDSEFTRLLKESADRADSVLCLELDLRPERLAELGTDLMGEAERWIGPLLRALDQESLFPAALRPCLASFEQFGPEGLALLERLLEPWRGRCPLIFESRFGQSARAGLAAAATVFDRWGADAAILCRWSGWDFLRPFLDRAPARGLYFALRGATRPGSWSLAELPVEERSGVSQPAWVAVARQVQEWGRPGMGAVIGSSFLGELARTASWLTREHGMFLLVPGVGEEGVDLSGIVEALRVSGGDPRTLRLGVGGAIVYAFEGEEDSDPVAAGVEAARRCRVELRPLRSRADRREDPIRTFLVEDHDLVRRAFRGMLEVHPDIAVTGDVGSAEQALQRLPGFWPDVILMDLALPGMNGLEATRRLRELGCPARIVVLSASEDFDDVIACLRAGAHGYMHKRVHGEELVESVRRAFRGEPVIPRDMIAPYLEFRAKEKRSSAPLSEREQEVLRLLGRGDSNREISDALGVAEGTIKSHVRSLFRKLGLASRDEAAQAARNLGLG